MSTNSQINYTNLTIDDLAQLLNDKLSSDIRFQNIKNSSIFSILAESILGSIDLANFNIERRAIETYLETAKLSSSVIGLARNIGYVVQRPIPAETSLSMTIQGPLPGGLVAGNILYLNRKSEFTLDGTPFVLKNTYQYTFTSSDITNGVGNPNFLKSINYGLVSNSDNYDLIVSATSVSAAYVVDIVLMQGEIKTETILGTETDQINLILQKYKINDLTFSNIYSENDLGYDPDSDSYDQSQNFTRVAIDTFDVFAAESAGTLSNYNSFFDIDKRSVINPNSSLLNTFTSAIPLCVIKTFPDGNTILEFGDDFFASKGLRNTSQNIYIQYFSTLGKKANQIGVIDQVLQTSEQFLVNSIDITSNLIFSLRKNILGGADIEDNESIKLNAPGIYSALERCVTKKDYISYLNSITSPVNIKNAIAWGEQEEMINGIPIKKLFNVVLFSVLGEIYDVNSDIHQVKMNVGSSDSNVLSGAVIDDLYSPYTISPNNRLNILIKESVTDELNENSELTSTSKVRIILNNLNRRGQITTKHVYITPFINEFDLTGIVYVKKLSNINYIQKIVNNSIYDFLNLKADFEVPVYLSDMVDLIKSNPNVVYTDIAFSPYSTSGVVFNYNSYTSTIIDNDITDWTPVGAESTVEIENVYKTVINEYLNSRTYYSYDELVTLFTSVTTKNISKLWKDDVNERSFYNELCKNLYDALKNLAGIGILNSFADSTGFNNTIMKLRNSFDYMIKWNMISPEGNIENFSFPNQIAKIRIQLTYVYK
jgi:hypothetical protein